MPQYELLMQNPIGDPIHFPIGQEGTIIGRSKKADVIIQGNSVSRRHARVWLDDDTMTVEDLGSRGGVSIQGERVERATLEHGDYFSVGSHEFMVIDTERPAPEFRPPPTPAISDPLTELAEASLMPAPPPTRISVNSEMRFASLIFDVQGLYDEILRMALDTLPARRGYIFSPGTEVDDPIVRASATRRGNTDGPDLNMTVVKHVQRSSRPLLKTNRTEEFAGRGRLDGNVEGTGLLCVPLMGRQGCVGVLYLDSAYEQSTFDEESMANGAKLAREGGAALESATLSDSRIDRERRAALEGAAANFAAALSDAILANAIPPEEAEAAPAKVMEKLDSLVTNLEALSGRRPLEKNPIDLRHSIARAASGLETSAASRKVKVNLDSTERALAFADPESMHRVIFNLLENAIAACAERGGEVSVSAKNIHGGCRIEVRDSGVGFPAGRMPRASDFDGNLGGKDGASFGLAAVFRIVAGHGGRIEFGPNATSGTVVTVLLPQQEGGAVIL